MNFMRSEVPEELRDIEIEMIKMKLLGQTDIDLEDRLKERVLNLKNVDDTKLGIIKPLTKPIQDYGRELIDGSTGGFPYHIKALKLAQDEFGMEINVGEKFMVLPILTDETTGVRVIRRKRIDLAFPIETGLPKGYEVDYECYLRSNLWGKVNSLFKDTTPRQLEKKIMTEDIIEELNGGM
jgi:hypothetical protein